MTGTPYSIARGLRIILQLWYIVHNQDLPNPRKTKISAKIVRRSFPSKSAQISTDSSSSLTMCTDWFKESLAPVCKDNEVEEHPSAVRLKTTDGQARCCRLTWFLLPSLQYKLATTTYCRHPRHLLQVHPFWWQLDCRWLTGSKWTVQFLQQYHHLQWVMESSKGSGCHQQREWWSLFL